MPSAVPYVLLWTSVSFVCVQANLAVQEIRLKVANNELASAEAQLTEKQIEFDKVKAKCDAAMKEKQVLWFSHIKHFLYCIFFKLKIEIVDQLKYHVFQDLLDDAEMCRNKMQAASALIDGLSGEKVRWIEQSKEFKSQINRWVTMKTEFNVEKKYFQGHIKFRGHLYL